MMVELPVTHSVYTLVTGRLVGPSKWFRNVVSR